MKYLQKTKEARRIKLDAKDKKILYILSSNARIPLTQLSKKVPLSRDAVNYRIKNYEKKGIIQGYRAMIDISKLGYKSYHLFLRLNNPSREIEQKIIDKLAKRPYIRTIIKFSGNFDFEIALIAKDEIDLDIKITQVTEDCYGFLQDYEILVITKTYATETLPKSFSGNIEKNAKTEKNNKKASVKLDEKDIKILKILGENAIIPLYEIGNKVNLSADAIAYRIRSMINSGIILRFIPIINYISLDYNLHTILLNISALDERKEKALKEFLSADKNVLWAVKAIGRFNALIYMLVKDIEELQNSIIKLRSLFPKQINHYETLIAYEEYKYTYFPSELF